MGTMTDDHLLSRCERIATSTWSDALDELAISDAAAGLGGPAAGGEAVGFRPAEDLGDRQGPPSQHAPVTS